MKLQEDYIISVIYGNTKRPKYQKSNRTYNFECPICNEGKSAGKKRRGFYIPAQDIIHCHNCEWHSRPLKWIQRVTNNTFTEICSENSEFIGTADSAINYYNRTNTDTSSESRALSLPIDSINLLRSSEVEFYKDNPVVRKGLEYITSRRITSAKYRPRAVYISIKDKIYPNSICFPFFNINNKISFFQVRELDPNAKAKYRSALTDKTLYNINKIDSDFLYIFLFEGPIDAMFIKNSVGLAGKSLSAKQESQLNMFPLHKQIWCLDNQRIDTASRELTRKLLKRGENVFIWPKKYEQFKDVNELCCEYGLDEISPSFIIDNTYSSEMQLIAAGLKL